MKTFNHDTVELPELKTKNIDKKRFYLTPDGNEYPSITTVLSVRNKEALFEWRKRVGNEVANHVSRQAMTRGTKVHHMCEDFLNNEFDINKAKKDFLPYCLFTRLAEEALCKIDMIKSQECGLYSDKYKVAGRVDCIAEYNGVLSIIDFNFLMLLKGKGITEPSNDFGMPTVDKPGNKCSFSDSLFCKFVAKYQSCQP